MTEMRDFDVHHLTASIESLLQRTRSMEDPAFDPRVKALVVTKLEEAALWSLKLLRSPDERRAQEEPR